MSLVFLHGFLGKSSDWDEVIAHLPHPCFAIDLPGHGDAPFTPDFNCYLESKINALKPIHLIGYSMGGRLALQYAQTHPVLSLILLSTHLGLKSDEERQLRLEKDRATAQRLLATPIDEFLYEWYAQPLFKQLVRKKDIASMRREQNKEGLAQALLAFSLGLQSDLSKCLPSNTIIAAGALDEAYRHRGQIIPNCGHALHLEDPKAVATLIQRSIS